MVMSRAPKLRGEDQSVADFVREHYGQEAVDYLAEPLLSGIYGGDPEALVGLDIRNVKTGEARRIDVDGAFVAIGHSPATELFKGKLPMDDGGYLVVEPGTTAA